ncbi:MAG: (2Fe-2S) ferredoxin domain-containing protein [Bacteroidales bacterium]|jgi:NADH:ubiquinone oxidoreductase subunit E|nr:(2Fe-2S) ferredoxin domain-containing protein [Bacteroidales bacterium]
MDQKVEIFICMGSSCFSRGNKENHRRIVQYVKSNNLESKISFRGKHCVGKCAEGPIIIVNGQEYTKVAPEDIMYILSTEFKKD